MMHLVLFLMICKNENQLNLFYMELFRFEWPIALNDIHRQRLYISIKNNSPLFAQEQTYMGEVSRIRSYDSCLIKMKFIRQIQIDLSNLDPEKTSIAWYALQEPNTSGVGTVKIKYDIFESNDQNTQL